MANNKPDAHELWARDCLAKAAYCEFALGVAVDGSYREWLQKLVGRGNEQFAGDDQEGS